MTQLMKTSSAAFIWAGERAAPPLPPLTSDLFDSTCRLVCYAPPPPSVQPAVSSDGSHVNSTCHWTFVFWSKCLLVNQRVHVESAGSNLRPGDLFKTDNHLCPRWLLIATASSTAEEKCLHKNRRDRDLKRTRPEDEDDEDEPWTSASSVLKFIFLTHLFVFPSIRPSSASVLSSIFLTSGQ